VDYYDFALLTGFHFYFFEAAALSPFIGANAYASRGSVNITNPAQNVPGYARPNLYGYEINVGFDLQSDRRRPYLRLRIGFMNDYGKLGTLSLNSTAFRVGLAL